VAQFDSAALRRRMEKFSKPARKPLYFRGFMAQFDGA
jgi:hypothetical protein